MGGIDDLSPVQVIRMSELVEPEPVGQHGMGAMLLLEGVPRKPSGAPYQPAYWVDPDSDAMVLVTDAEGHPLGHHDDGDGDIPERLEDWCFSRLPDEVADAARAAIAEQGPPDSAS